MIAETWLGALAWAPGSQTCKGMMPAFKPKPTRAQDEDRRGRPWVHGARRRQRVGLKRLQGEGTAGGPQQAEERQQAERRHVRRHQVDPAAAADLPHAVFRRHEEEGRQGHDLPAEEEQHAVAGDHHQGHAGRQRAVEEPQLAAVLGMFRLLPVAQAVDVAQQRNQEDRQQEDGRDGVDADEELARRARPTASGSAAGSRRRPRRAPTPASPAADPSTASSVVSHCPALDRRGNSSPAAPLAAAKPIPRSSSDSLMTILPVRVSDRWERRVALDPENMRSSGPVP